MPQLEGDGGRCGDTFNSKDPVFLFFLPLLLTRQYHLDPVLDRRHNYNDKETLKKVIGKRYDY